jgi:hypothetical protein
MNPSSALRLASGAFLATIVAALAHAFGVAADSRGPAVLPLIPVVGGLLGLIGVTVGTISLLLQKRWGAWVYLLSILISLISDYGMGAQFDSAGWVFVDRVLYTLAGLIFGLAFFADTLPSKDRKNADESTRTADFSQKQ